MDLSGLFILLLMRNCISLLFPLLLLCNCSTNESPYIKAVYGLIERVTPGYSEQFELQLIEKDGDSDVYEIEKGNGKIILRGNNAVSLATAYNQYLKYTCKVHMSWLGDQMNLPEKLPMPETFVRNRINGKYRVYMNYCTFSYSAAWWDWKRWERELDYMAMNSINTPLSVVGLEAVWYNTLLKYGFTDIEARTFLAAPGHMAWQWMQNIQGYGGPLPKSWIDKHVELGKKIIKRQLELGMQPIQQGFSGYVPRELKEKYPDAKIRLQPSWCGFKGSAQLDPTDSLFMKFGRDFLEEQKKIFGSYGFYAADPFHESKPPVDTPEYLGEVGKGIYKLFTDFDKDAMWVMQAWSLREAIVKAVPKEHLLILDLNGAKSNVENAFWGYPAVAGNLHNFGGRINMHGDMRLLASNQYMKANSKSVNICGSGLFMEGIEQNPLYYELAFEMPLYNDSVCLDKWMMEYAWRRYGSKSDAAYNACMKLLDGPYSQGTNGTERSSIIAARPALDVKKSGPNAGLGIPYNPLLLFEVQELLLADSAILRESSAYRFDIVDVQRQLMSNMGQAIHSKAAKAFNEGEIEDFRLHSGRFLELIADVDTLLRTRQEFNLYKWIADARSWGENEEEKDLFERDAVTLVTVWGADGDPLIFDYSWREWCGLIGTYYLPRWKSFYTMLEDCLTKGLDYDEEGLPLTHGREALRANDYYNRLADWELEYVASTNKTVADVTIGDELQTVKRLYEKYRKLAGIYYDGNNFLYKKSSSEKLYENLGEN